MGTVARTKRAARCARATVRYRASQGLELVTPEAMREIVPPAYVEGLRYRTVKRIVARALGMARKQAGPIFVGRHDARYATARTESPEDVAARRDAYIKARAW